MTREQQSKLRELNKMLFQEVHMKISEMLQDDIGLVLPFYIEHYNEYEGNCWTEKTAGKRIRQLFSIDDNYALIMKDCDDKAIGFVIGYFKQYDDLIAYTLEEIVISHSEQNKGYGTMLLSELEKRVKEKGGAGIELQAVKDQMHEKYYGKAGFHDADNFTMKCKWF